MNIQTYPMCCGAGILTHLFWEGSKSYMKEKIRRRLVRAKAAQWGCITGVANAEQEDTVKLLEEFGFRCIMHFANPVHGGNPLKLMGLDLNTITFRQLGEPRDPPKTDFWIDGRGWWTREEELEQARKGLNHLVLRNK